MFMGGSCCAACSMIIWRCGRCASSALSRSSAMRERCAARVEPGHVRALETVFGTVSVERLAYRAPGVGNLHPADAALNLPVERHSHGLRKLCALESPRGSFDGAIDAICRQTGVRLGKRQVEELAGLAAMDFEDFYESPPSGAREAGRSVGALGRRQGDRDASGRAAHPRAGQAPRGPRAQTPPLRRGAAEPQADGRDRRRLRRQAGAAHPGRHPHLGGSRRAMSPPRGRWRETSG